MQRQTTTNPVPTTLGASSFLLLACYFGCWSGFLAPLALVTCIFNDKPSPPWPGAGQGREQRGRVRVRVPRKQNPNPNKVETLPGSPA